MEELLVYTILGSYAFTAGAYLFTAWVFRYATKKFEQIVFNHIHGLEKKLLRLEAQITPASHE